MGQQGSGNTTDVTTFTKRASKVSQMACSTGATWYLGISSFTIPVNVNGSWKNSAPYVNVNGVWKPSTMFAKVNGVWVKAKE